MIREKTIKKINEYFIDKSNIILVILYGSITDEQFSNQSDVDIAIAGETSPSFEYLLNINSELQILLERDIDLLDIKKIKGLLHYKIFTKGILLKGSSSLTTDNLIKALDFHADFLPQLNQMRKNKIERFINGT